MDDAKGFFERGLVDGDGLVRNEGFAEQAHDHGSTEEIKAVAVSTLEPKCDSQLDAKLEVLNCLLNIEVDARNAVIEGENALDLAARASDPAWLAALNAP